ncbi:hypothetical protein BH10BDE1_BH10BDE1_23330 [soil metagenome]
MRQRIFQFAVLSGMVFTLSSTMSWASKKEVEPTVKGSISAKGISKADYPKTAKISASDAGKTAASISGGNVLSVGLENEDGFLVYAVEVAGTPTGQHEILVDAGNGKILADMRHSGDRKSDNDDEGDEHDDD